MNSQLYENGNPAALLPKLQLHWPAIQFNLDIVKCQEVLEKVIRTEFIENAFVAGGFFICFNKLAPFSQKFKLFFDSCVNKYGLSIFFDKRQTNDFNLEKIIRAEILDRFVLSPILEKFNFAVWTAFVDDIPIRINLSQFETGFSFLNKFDFESSKIWYTPKNPKSIYISKEFLKGNNKSEMLKQTSEQANTPLNINFSSNERRLIQTFKGLTDEDDVKFLKFASNYF